MLEDKWKRSPPASKRNFTLIDHFTIHAAQTHHHISDDQIESSNCY